MNHNYTEETQRDVHNSSGVDDLLGMTLAVLDGLRVGQKRSKIGESGHSLRR